MVGFDLKRSSKNGSDVTGEELLQILLSRKLSRPRLAEFAGGHSDRVRNWERKGRIDLDGYAPPRLLSALGVDLSRRQRGIFLSPTYSRHGLFLRKHTSNRRLDVAVRKRGKTRHAAQRRFPVMPHVSFMAGYALAP